MTRDEKLSYYYEKLLKEDEVEVVEILDLSTEDIVERFRDCIEERLEYIESYFDETDGVDAMMKIITGDQL